MKKLLLLDAYALIYRSYYAFIKNPRVNSKGLNTSPILGFVNTLNEVLRTEKPSHIGVAFDSAGPTFRHEAFEQYKAQREATPEDIRKAVPYIRQLVEAYRIPLLELPGFEADDVIGSLAKQAEKEDFDVYMLTPDKDYGQLVSERIKMYRPRHGGGYEVMGPTEVCEKYGLLTPIQVVDLLGLMGDTSDNIPGCPGIGPKTAAQLLQEFGSIPQLLLHTDALKGGLKTRIEAHRQEIEFSRFLATIRTDAPIPLDVEALSVKPANEQALQDLYRVLEFRSHLKKMEESPARTAPPIEKQLSLFASEETSDSMPTMTATAFPPPVPHTHCRTADSPTEIQAMVEEFRSYPVAALATLTEPDESVFHAQLRAIAFCRKAGQAVIVPLTPDTEKNRLEALRPLLEDGTLLKTGHRLKYDLMLLHLRGIRLQGALFDTHIAHYLLQPEVKHDLAYLAEVYLQRTLQPEAAEYAGQCADSCLCLKTRLETEIRQQQADFLMYEVEMPLLRCLAQMQLNGVRIDTEVLRQQSEVLTRRMQEVEAEMQQCCGEKINPNSPKQIGLLLFEKLRLSDKAKKTRTGQYVTSEEVLEGLRGRHPIVEKILEYRGIKKLLSTYIDVLPLLINPQTGKIHTSFNQGVTATGRLSSSDPNLQNIPIREQLGREIRKAFVPDEGCVFLSADYSQIELRLMAHLSGDPSMREDFRLGHDVHAATAARIYKVPLEQVTAEQRRKAKTANFGIIYGISTFGLSERLDIPRAEAKALIEGYFATYPGIRDYMDASIAQVREKGYAETLFHRKRYLPDIHSTNSVVRGYAERNAINAPIQGSAADLIKIVMVRVSEAFAQEHLRSQMILQVHDELNFNVYPEELERVKIIVKEAMEQAVPLAVPLVADMGIGANWLEAH